MPDTFKALILIYFILIAALLLISPDVTSYLLVPSPFTRSFSLVGIGGLWCLQTSTWNLQNAWPGRGWLVQTSGKLTSGIPWTVFWKINVQQCLIHTVLISYAYENMCSSQLQPDHPVLIIIENFMFPGHFCVYIISSLCWLLIKLLSVVHWKPKELKTCQYYNDCINRPNNLLREHRYIFVHAEQSWFTKLYMIRQVHDNVIQQLQP